MMIDLEDNVSDIVSKAQRGLGLSDSELAKKSGASIEAIRQTRGGDFDEGTLRAIAPVLELDADALVDLTKNKWRPAALENFEGLAQFNTDYGGMSVNAYLVWDPETKHAVAFDTGADSAPMLKLATKENLSIKMILLTHAHPDHVADLPRLREQTCADVFAPAREPIPGAGKIGEGKHFQCGKIDIEPRSTWGHSPGGMTFVCRGLARPIAIVGDSIFAGSMGGGNVSYKDAVRNNLEQILTLPDDTIICPGHGPMTSVGEEKKHNPFFAKTRGG
ncbi:MAG TPA: MBL fold metallo-hydrolase [Chthoniobacterales bacterium]|jgi:glyoxylase-like metal-dependent hydrolase (beta-lactamase superfamily II)|nr:MBL fold metallo-hydrolase [Chthoniobacterales bacterium]